MQLWPKGFRNLLSLFIFLYQTLSFGTIVSEGLPLYYWKEPADYVNFGDYLSLKIVERMVNTPIEEFGKHPKKGVKKLLAVGSLLYYAYEGDVIWGTGLNGKTAEKRFYTFENLDVRAVRGPITREFLLENFYIECPEIYGDPALLLPYLYPEFRRKPNPKYPYLIIPHYKEFDLFPRENCDYIVYPSDPWEEILDKILDAELVISSALHGIIVAEAFGIPARMLRVSERESILKYHDYYQGTNRPDFTIARSLEEAILMGGERPYQCDLEKLYDAFPFEFWPNANPIKPDFSKKF